MKLVLSGFDRKIPIERTFVNPRLARRYRAVTDVTGAAVRGRTVRRNRGRPTADPYRGFSSAFGRVRANHASGSRISATVGAASGEAQASFRRAIPSRSTTAS